MDNNLIRKYQPGFKPEHNCVNQLLKIKYDIYKSFVRSVFLCRTAA